MKDDAISKYVLIETKKPNQILSDIKSSDHDRVLAKIMAHQTMEKHVQTMCEKYPVIREMLEKLGKPKPRKKKVKKSKQTITPQTEDQWVVESTSDTTEPKQNEPKKLKTQKTIKEKGDPSTSNEIETKQKATAKKMKMLKKTQAKENGSVSDEIEAPKKLKIPKLVEGKENDSDGIEMKQKTPKKGPGKLKRPIVSEISEVKPLLEVIQPKAPNKSSQINKLKDENRIKPHKKLIIKTDDDEMSEDVPAGSTQIDSFFLTGDKEDKFLNINIKTDDSSEKEVQVNKIYNDNLNRKQRRTLAKGGKITKPKSFNNFNNKNSFNSLSFMKSDRKGSNNIVKEVVTEVKEVLHPSWQAKKLLKPQIAQFEGKKIVFDD